MISFNQFVLHGTIGHIEQREGSGDRAMTTIALYVDDDYKPDGGDWVDRSYRIPITFFGPRATGIFSAFKKGDEVIITGKITSAVTENDGNKEYRYYFNGDQLTRTLFTVKGGSNQNGAERPAANGKAAKPAPQRRPNPQPAANKKSSWSKNKAENFVEEEFDKDDELSDLNFGDEDDDT